MKDCAFVAGDVLFREGDPADFAYLIHSGHVEIRKSTPYGTVRVRGPGGIIDDRPRSAAARTIDNVQASAFDQRAFVNMLFHRPGDSLMFIRSLCERLRTLTDRFGSLETTND